MVLHCVGLPLPVWNIVTRKKESYREYFDFVINFRKKIRRIKYARRLFDLKVIEGIFSIDGEDEFLKNRKLFHNLQTKNQSIKSIYYSIETISLALHNLKLELSLSSDYSQNYEHVVAYNKIFFFRDDDKIYSWFDHETLKNNIENLKNIVNKNVVLNMKIVQLNFPGDDIVGFGEYDTAPWKIPGNNEINC